MEILYLDGRPNHRATVAPVERVSPERGTEPILRLVNVRDKEAGRPLRLLGTTTIRVGGVDVDRQMVERSDSALSLRAFQTEAELSGKPDERWVRNALLREAARGR